MADVATAVKNSIANELSLMPKDILPGLSMDELNIDEMDVLNIVMNIEEELDVVLEGSDEEALLDNPTNYTVQKVIDLFTKAVASNKQSNPQQETPGGEPGVRCQ